MSSDIFHGDPIAPGFAVGYLRALGRVSKHGQVFGASIENPSAEVERFRGHVDALEEEIEDAVERLESESFGGEAEILRSHLAMLRDPELHDQVLRLIRDTRYLAEAAVEQVLETMAEMLAGAEDPMLADRAVDFRDLAVRLASRLSEHSVYDGTNDLVQYLFAVERNTANVADFYQPAHPVVLQIIRELAQQADNAGKPFGIANHIGDNAGSQ